jgi:beta-lactamase regulating signal transducer with metallopeptidase domain
MSLTAGIVIVLVLLARLPLKKAPKVFSYVLWAVVLFRLLCPVSFSSNFSLLNMLISPTVTNGSITYFPTDLVHSENLQAEPPLPVTGQTNNENLIEGEQQPTYDPLDAPMEIAAYLWLFGVAGMLTYSMDSVKILKKRLKSARNTGGNIYEADHLKTPFVLGLFRPRIFIPSGFKAEEKSYIIRHERAHIRRFDHIIKPFAFLVLSIHWFNPLVWIAFVAMSTDMELSCDERVIKEMGIDIKKAYSTSLLSLATEKRIINGSPLAFGEGNVGGRIKNELNYKKPAFWVIAVAVIAVMSVGIGLLANPRQMIPIMDAGSFPGNPQFDQVVSVTLSGPVETGDATTTIATKDGYFGWGQLVDFLETVKIDGKEINRNLSENRDKTYQIVFNNENDIELEFNFNGDFTKVWMSNGVKPSYSYKVMNHSDVSEYLSIFFDSLDPEIQNVLSAEPLIFLSVETDLIKLGTAAFDTYMGYLISETTPVEERIASYALNDISVLAGDINEFCVSINYDFTTDNDSFVNSSTGIKGKGTWPDNDLEIRVKYAYDDVYSIKGIGTGGGQGLAPSDSEQALPDPALSEGAEMISPDSAADFVMVKGMTAIGPENGADEYGYILSGGDCFMFPYYGQPVPKLEHYLFCVDARYSVNDSSGKNDMWLQISPVMSGYLHPGLQQYWILESNALAYTEETKPFLRAPVFLAEDTLDADGKAIELPYPNVWILNSRNGDRASIARWAE